MRYVKVNGWLVNLSRIEMIEPYDDLVMTGRPDHSCEREIIVPCIKFYGNGSDNGIMTRFKTPAERDACFQWLEQQAQPPGRVRQTRPYISEWVWNDEDAADDEDTDDDGFDFGTYDRSILF